MSSRPLVAIISGSASDQDLVAKAEATLKEFGVSCESKVLSAHRTPNKLAAYVRDAEANGTRVFIAIAGLAAALPGVVAAHTTLPVIGVPGSGGPLNGVDALYSIVQMPPGIPVATVGIGNSKNAAMLAIHILALLDANLRERLVSYRAKLENS